MKAIERLKRLRVPKFFVLVPEMNVIPRGYGVCYSDDYRRHVSVCCPIPFNWLVRWGRTAYWAVANPKPSWSDEQQYEELLAKRKALWREAELEVLRALNRWDAGSDDPVWVAYVMLIARSDDVERLKRDMAMFPLSPKAREKLQAAFARHAGTKEGQEKDDEVNAR